MTSLSNKIYSLATYFRNYEKCCSNPHTTLLWYGMSEFITVTFSIKSEDAFRGSDAAIAGYVESMSCNGQSIGGIEAYGREDELQHIETTMKRSLAARAFLFIATDMGEDIIEGPPSPAVFLAKMCHWTTNEPALLRLQKESAVFGDNEVTGQLNESSLDFDPQVGA